REVDARLVHGVDRGDEGELREAIDSLGILRVDIAVGRPVMHVAAELYLVVGGVEALEVVNAALAGEDALPQLFDLTAERGDGAHACDDDSSFHRFVGGTESEPGIESRSVDDVRLEPSSPPRWRTLILSA